MDKPQHPLYSAEVTREKLINDVRKDMSGKKNRFPQLYWIITLALLIGIWQLAAVHIHFALLMPSPWSTFKALLQSVADPKILIALLITLKRVGIGFAVACLIGISLGYLIGDSHYGLGTAHDSLVWIGRRSDNLPDCFCRTILYHAEYDFRRARYLSRLL